ncbi:MAG: serine/threonine protein kinase [Actinobacteria bacterium]|nr:serine/threonine protein kinase [Actinomycetota bacterium]
MPTVVDDRYELLDVLASGGMATVWRARDRRLERLVALKRPHPAPAGDPTHQRIELEARVLGSLSHPNLVTIFDSGSDADGPFLVMELIEGPTLAAVGANLDPAQILEASAQVADALATVHAAGIVHRDVKPANILMSERGPQLTDFGIARSADGTSGLTLPGTVLATPSFAAPEVLAGADPTPASDVFSLGVIVYSLLAGRPPFTGTDRDEPPPPLGDPALDALLAATLSPDPAQRPAPQALAAALRASSPTELVDVSVDAAPLIPTAVDATVPLLVVPEAVIEPAARRRWMLPAALAVAALIILASALSAGAPINSSATAVGTTTPPATTGTSILTTTTIATTTTTTDPVAAAQAAFAAALGAIPPSELKPKDSSEIQKKVDEAVAAAAEGDSAEAEKKLREASEAIEKKLDDSARDEVLSALEDLASALGLTLERSEDDDD